MQDNSSVESPRLNPVEREQLAAQIVAIMQSVFKRPSASEMRKVLACADSQITAQVVLAEQAAARLPLSPQPTMAPLST